MTHARALRERPEEQARHEPVEEAVRRSPDQIRPRPLRPATQDGLAAVAVRHDGLILASDLEFLGLDSRILRRALARGDLERIRRGVYVDATTWREATGEGRHRLRVRAAALVLPHLLFSHQSAAALLGLPRIGGWDDVVHTLGDRATVGRPPAWCATATAANLTPW